MTSARHFLNDFETQPELLTAMALGPMPRMDGDAVTFLAVYLILAAIGARSWRKRNAGEDFYLLEKLSKVAPLRKLSGAPILLRSRESFRVPFGTGPRA